MAVDFSLIQQHSSITMNDPQQIKIQAIDCPGYNNDDLKSQFGFLVPIIIEIAYMFTLLINIGNIVAEKQSKMKVNSVLLLFII